jgi:cytochrome c oxidase cbb3-type subunit 3
MMEENKNIMDHEYDGIQELDNPPPRWIMALFYITIGISILYAANFFWLDIGDNQDVQYAKKSAAHDAKYQIANVAQDEMGVLTDVADLENGRRVYDAMACLACHGMNGEGNPVGPNLTDNYWINGCDFQSVFSVIKNGNPTKGMTAFKGQISDTKIQEVASYVMSLKGSNPPNPKDAQGELCE